MIYQHEIPSKSKLYFGQSAKIKREIESNAATTLEQLGFTEIVTPFFSYHQHESFSDKKGLVRVADEQNHEVTLRADSTVDVVRIVTKRLGRSSENKKWFYIQPAVSYPTTEQYQIGAEIIDGSFTQALQSATKLLSDIEVDGILQIANIKIPKILNEQYGISLELLQSMHIEKMLEYDYEWLVDLVKINKISDLDNLNSFPQDIKSELEILKDAAKEIDYNNIVISPLFYAKMRYYESLTFRVFDENALLATGGIYSVEGVVASGFAIYTDECIAVKMDKQ
jgi:histidyl-tRNA synthetase